MRSIVVAAAMHSYLFMYVSICPSTDKGPVLNAMKFAQVEIHVLNQNAETPFPQQNIVSPFPVLLE